jgi:hypothetical protein
MMSATPQLDILIAAAALHPQWHWYAIADSAQDKSLPAAISTPGAGVRCLLGATQGSPLAEQSPHLVRLNPPSHGAAAWQWIARMAPRKPCVTVLASRLSFDALFAQLKQFTEISLPDDFDMFFAFWDPAILGTLLGQADDQTLHVKGPVFNEEQRKLLVSGLDGWWYWDRDGAVHSVEVDPGMPQLRSAAPISLRQQQVDDLVEASLPDHVLYFVRLNQPHLLDKISEQSHYAFASKEVTKARKIGLDSMNELVNYVCAALIYGAQWESNPSIRSVMSRVESGELKFGDALKLLP